VAPYLYILSLSGLLALSSIMINTKKYTYFFILFLFTITAFFIGFRHEEIGPDWYTYKELFLNMSNFNFLHSLSIGDPAYFSIMWLLRYFGHDVISVNILFSVLTVAFYTKFCSHQKLPYLAFFIGLPFLIIYTMNFPRQSIAMAIGSFALLHILSDNKSRAFLWILLAVLFHKTAIIYLVFLLNSLRKMNILNTFLILIAGFLIFYFFILSHLSGYIFNFSTLMHSNAAHLKGMVYLLPVLLYLIFYKSVSHSLSLGESTMINRFSILCIISYVALFTSAFLYNAIDRIYVYFLPFEIIIFSTFIAKNIKSDQMLYYVVPLIFYKFVLFYIWLEFSFNSSHFVPYSLHNI
tara:strand:+ start:47197 stop:48249 length:1053 start_codon:yes stop_codon:yes gene_type:complete